MVISIGEERTSDKIQHPFMIKTLTKVGIGGIYLNIIKAILWQNHSQHNTKWWKAESCPTKSTIPRQGCSFSPLLFNAVLEVLATAIT